MEILKSLVSEEDENYFINYINEFLEIYPQFKNLDIQFILFNDNNEKCLINTKNIKHFSYNINRISKKLNMCIVLLTKNQAAHMSNTNIIQFKIDEFKKFINGETYYKKGTIAYNSKFYPIVHELGHYFQYKKCKINNEYEYSTFIKIFNKFFISKYSNTNNEELYAELYVKIFFEKGIKKLFYKLYNMILF